MIKHLTYNFKHQSNMYTLTVKKYSKLLQVYREKNIKRKRDETTMNLTSNTITIRMQPNTYRLIHQEATNIRFHGASFLSRHFFLHYF